MTQQHPITPLPELVQQWLAQRADYEKGFNELLIEAAQWGADQELEACLGEVSFLNGRALADRVRTARRPKPPNLKRVALLQLDTLNADLGLEDKGVDLSQIRRALEQLDD